MHEITPPAQGAARQDQVFTQEDLLGSDIIGLFAEPGKVAAPGHKDGSAVDRPFNPEKTPPHRSAGTGNEGRAEHAHRKNVLVAWLPEHFLAPPLR
jgi:hypothetical protein